MYPNARPLWAHHVPRCLWAQSSPSSAPWAAFPSRLPARGLLSLPLWHRPVPLSQSRPRERRTNTRGYRAGCTNRGANPPPPFASCKFISRPWRSPTYRSIFALPCTSHVLPRPDEACPSYYPLPTPSPFGACPVLAARNTSSHHVSRTAPSHACPPTPLHLQGPGGRQ